MIKFIKTAVVHAIQNVGDSESSFKLINIQQVKILTEEKLYKLSVLVDQAIKYTKKIAPRIYIPAILTALLLFIIILFNGGLIRL